MTQRITGTNSGIDVDNVVKQSLSKEQNKIDKAYQQQMVYTYQQEQLNTIVNDAQDFFDKYLDRLSSDSLLSTKAYETLKFTATDQAGNPTTAVTAKGYAGAEVGNYSVNVTQIAKKATTTLKTRDFSEAINSGDGVLAVTMKNSEGKDVTAYVDIVFKNGEISMSDTATALNTELKKKGINVSAKYSDFSKGIVLEAGSSGEDYTFGTAIKSNLTTGDNKENEDGSTEFDAMFRDSFGYHSGQNAKGTIIKGSGPDAVVYQIDRPSNSVYVDDIEFTFNSTTSTTTTTSSTIDDLEISDIESGAVATITDSENNKTTVMKKNHTVTTQTYNDGITFKKITSNANISDTDKTKVYDLLNGTTTGSISINGIKIETTEDSNGRKKVEVTANGRTVDFTGAGFNGTTVSKDGMSINLSPVTSDSTWNFTLNDTTVSGNLIPEKGSSSIRKLYDNGLVVETIKTTDSDGKDTYSTNIVSGIENFNQLYYNEYSGYNVSIESEDGKVKTTSVEGIDPDGQRIRTKTTVAVDDVDNTITNQKITTSILNGESVLVSTSEIKSTQAVKLEGKTDITALKDNIIKFVDDYNKLMESINEKLWEKRDKDYMPLTEEQKKEMSDSEIEAWEKKAKTGLLRSDSDLRRIQSSMKSAMSAVMSGTGLYLESIGIEPIKNNYTTKNGMLKIDESKLTSALENNAAEVKDLFTRNASGDDKGGVLIQLQSVLKSEFKDSDSALSQRIGFEGTSTESNNTLNNNISKQKKLITELKKKYSNKETLLYNKYSNLEVMLEKLNSQYNSLASLLGQ